MSLGRHGWDGEVIAPAGGPVLNHVHRLQQKFLRATGHWSWLISIYSTVGSIGISREKAGE
jgi:hypothetical protein